MRTMLFRTFAGVLAGGAIAATAAPVLDIPPIAFRDRTLANGLRVLSVEDHASPTVGVQVWYRVGSKDDPPGRSGFAHLFEHMMFKSTKYLRNEQMDRLTEDVGGENNASTWDDLTEYHEVVPSNHLERLLWAEAERMAHLDVNEANFTSERAVVEEEFRQRILAQPYGRFFYAIEKDSFRVHPYQRPGIGRIEDLEASRLDDVRAFHATFYRPDNAVLVVAGDFDAAQLDAWVDKYFAPVAKPQGAIPRVTVTEPAWPDDRTHAETAPNVPLPAVAITWLGPRAEHHDIPALHIAEALLAGGESSRLNQALVYRAQSASQAGFSVDARVDATLLAAYAIAANGRSLDENVKALDAEIERLASGPIETAELDKVKTQLVTQALLQRQTPNGIATALGRATLIDGDPKRANTELADLQAVTADDVHRVVATYLIGAHRNVIDYRAGKE